jgi:predicted oxidoreductase (fatty acid repression mutant protein)
MSTELETTDEILQPDHTGLQTYLGHVLKRRSIRKLTSGPISDEVLRNILEAGRWSPSSNNSQPARIVVIKERQAEFWDFVANALRQKLQGEQLERALSRIPGYRSGIFTLVFYEDTEVSNNPPFPGAEELWKNFAAQAMGIIQANVWNAIAAAGLAASNQHINLQIEDELRAFLGVPATWKSYSIFPVGYASETPAEGTRHPHEKVIFYEHGPAA